MERYYIELFSRHGPWGVQEYYEVDRATFERFPKDKDKLTDEQVLVLMAAFRHQRIDVPADDPAKLVRIVKFMEGRFPVVSDSVRFEEKHGRTYIGLDFDQTHTVHQVSKPDNLNEKNVHCLTLSFC